MKNILVVLDGSEADELALGQAIELSNYSQGKLQVLMTVYDQIEEMHRYVGFDNFKDVKQAILDDSETKLRRLTDRFNLKFSSSMAWGKRWSRPAVDKSKRMKADLVIKVSGDQQSRISKILRTPEDWNLLRDLQCPLWLVNSNRTPLERVVVAINALAESPEHRALDQRVIAAAQDMAQALDLKLQLVTVMPDFSSMALATAYVPPVPGQAILWEDTGEKFRARCQEVLDDQAKALSIEAETIVLGGRVDRELAEQVGNNALLVLGSAADRGLAGKLIGNTAEKVLHYLATDLLIVH